MHWTAQLPTSWWSRESAACLCRQQDATSGHILCLQSQTKVAAMFIAGHWAKHCPPLQTAQYPHTASDLSLLQLLPTPPAAVPPASWCQVSVEVNALLRRELRAAAGELRRGASAELAAAGQAGEGDYNLCKERGGGSSTSQPR